MTVRTSIYPVLRTQHEATVQRPQPIMLPAVETASNDEDVKPSYAFEPHAIQAPAANSEGKVLIVDDDLAVRRALETTLRILGFQVTETASGDEALGSTSASECDVLLLDLKMPGMNGLDACREFRRRFPHLPILILSVRDSEDDKVRALDAGADDYVTKPFHIRELIARVRAAVRRVRTTEDDKVPTIQIGAIALDPVRREVHKDGRTLRLTPKEFDLLHYFMRHADLPIAHARLLSAVWGPEYRGEVEYLRTFVRQLRKKLEDDPANPAYLLTDIQFGYCFRNSGGVSAWLPGCAEGD